MRIPGLRALAIALCILAVPVAVSAQNAQDSVEQPLADYQAPIAGTHLISNIITPGNFPSDIGQAVAAAFPPKLVYGPDAPLTDSAAYYQYRGCASMVQGGGNGAPGLAVVAYSGTKTEIALLSYDGGQATIIDLVPPKAFKVLGGACTATTVNLADPAQSDSPLSHGVQISFQGTDWFFLWNGQKLVDITALDPGSGFGYGPNTDMYRSDIVDIDRTGPMQIIGENGDADRISRSDGIASTGTYTLFRYNGKAYAPGAKYRFFQDDCGPAGGNENRLSMHRTPAPTYLLTVYNGARDGSQRATGATVKVNGKTVLGPGQINASTGKVSQIVQLNHNNMIDVTTQGKGQLVFYVTIQKSK
jgi:hypothetical protein